MPSSNRCGRHSTFGTICYWSLAVVVASATGLSLVRWAEKLSLFFLGTLSAIAATLGRIALQKRWPNWVSLHITGMGLSYVPMPEVGHDVGRLLKRISSLSASGRPIARRPLVARPSPAWPEPAGLGTFV